MGKESLIFQGLLVLVTFVCITQTTKTVYDSSNFPQHNHKLIESNYTPRGEEYTLGNLTVYETPNRSSKRVLIHIYDIFGMSVNIRQVADSMAALHDFRVVIPRIFREEYWNEGNFPPANHSELDIWVEENASWEKVAKYDVLNIINWFQTRENITEFAIFGMCYGGIISTMAATEIPEIKAAGLVHPTYVTNEHAEGVKAPMYLLPTSTDADFLPFYEVLKTKFGDNCGHRRMTDMVHGFAGAGGDFSDPLTVQRVEEVIDILGVFFNKNLNNS
ncbi:putative AIM2 family protein C30D10.14 [Orchesella cincta]|uniref:Putative AIM2 family protein C30D10.14 n=1 Tax=Orchesella cincta TaxID=48709 RepID=A0A1D2M7R6_ORCCI|nr:putative AIM2 family protein C30D10.14 [Orchesella cincta]